MSTNTHDISRLKRTEKLFFCTFLIVSVLHFLLQYGKFIGFDVDPHLSHLASLRWTSFSPEIHSDFYVYQPPLGFLIPMVVRLLGFGNGQSVQITSFVASLCSFFLIRETLRSLGLLLRTRSVIFLYVAFSLPIIVHLSTSINLDIVLLALTTAVILLCTTLWWKRPRSKWSRLMLYAMLCVCLCAAMFVKFSGVLLLTIPPAAAFFSPQRARAVSVAVLISMLAAFIVFPYYEGRYYREAGTFFPNNGDLFQEFAEKFQDARMMRDENRLAYVVRMFTPGPIARTQNPGYRDYSVMRFSDTWRDVWSGDVERIPMTSITAAIASFYLVIMPFLFLFGLAGCCFIICKSRTSKQDVQERNFGSLLLIITIINIVALLWYMYRNPVPDWRSGKGIYIAPALLGVAWILVHADCLCLSLRSRGAKVFNRRRIIFIILTFAFMIINHLVPVY